MYCTVRVHMYTMHKYYDCKQEVVNSPENCELPEMCFLKVTLPYWAIPYTFYSGNNQDDKHDVAEDGKAQQLKRQACIFVNEAHPCLKAC